MQEELDASKLAFGEEFARAKCLMNAEVALILEKKVESLQENSLDPLQQLSPVLEKSLLYVKQFRQYENPESVRQVREVLAGQHKLHEFEVCSIANLAPDSVDEVKSLIPSLAMEDRDPPIDDEEIEQMLSELQTIRNYAE